MPSQQEWVPKEEWAQLHKRLFKNLGLPCRLIFSTDWEFAAHVFGDGCYVAINPYMNFYRPEHLLLHEAAHHVIAQVDGRDHRCLEITDHCSHWAMALCGLYEKAAIAFPLETRYKTFARIIGIKLETKNISPYITA